MKISLTLSLKVTRARDEPDLEDVMRWWNALNRTGLSALGLPMLKRKEKPVTCLDCGQPIPATLTPTLCSACIKLLEEKNHE